MTNSTKTKLEAEAAAAATAGWKFDHDATSEIVVPLKYPGKYNGNAVNEIRFQPIDTQGLIEKQAAIGENADAMALQAAIACIPVDMLKRLHPEDGVAVMNAVSPFLPQSLYADATA
ncbi:hypothetical protein [Maritalea porphyrae]|uniref:hypothetical protein n=1 Tax=Maritalea porphyrae TaxID=880732 RepID=UPI0022AFC0B4|nr:hypothetical protein [Maritalea porphyrae]MCZ4272467.1 hypothetical protein [Maritalea porphyrae]